jgi:Lon protease-like protein
LIYPLFPLPNVVLFPTCYLPLHVFEARYRFLVADAEAIDRLLVIALLKPGWEAPYHLTPAVHSVACLARMVAVEPLPEGRYNILLEGVDRVRILDEVRSRAYRQVITRVLPAPDETQEATRGSVLELVSEILSRLPNGPPDGLLERLEAISSTGMLADTVAHILQFPVPEKQSLLETIPVSRRLEALRSKLADIRARME